MVEVRILTTDDSLVADLNAAQIAGVHAKYCPKMAYDSAEHIFEIAITIAATKALDLTIDWLVGRFKKTASETKLVINGKVIQNADQIVNVVHQSTIDKDRSK